MLRPLPFKSPFLSVLHGQPAHPPPIWLMRQAGRYLPEYRKIRAEVASFLDLCRTPELAAEVTLQPMRRFGLDAAIVFSDILMVPFALGQRVEFIEGEGPRLDALRGPAGLSQLDFAGAADLLAPVYETIVRVRRELGSEIPVIGFCGAPWTVATYMVEGSGSKDQAAARIWAYRDPQSFQALIDLLVDASATYLIGQVRAGAQALQLFDSWAGSLAEDEFARWCIAPTKAIVQRVKAAAPGLPIIGFPRGCGLLAETYAREAGVDAVGCDTGQPLAFIRETLQPLLPVQGNLDPLLLLAGGNQLDLRVATILEALQERPFIFNLGHGIHPDTPVEHVAKLVSLVRKG